MAAFCPRGLPPTPAPATLPTKPFPKAAQFGAGAAAPPPPPVRDVRGVGATEGHTSAVRGIFRPWAFGGEVGGGGDCGPCPAQGVTFLGGGGVPGRGGAGPPGGADFLEAPNAPKEILLPSAVHLEERLTVSQSVPEPAGRQSGRQSDRYTKFGFFVSGRCGPKQQRGRLW